MINLKNNSILYFGIVVIILNALFFGFNFFINISGLFFIVFSDSITKFVNRLLKENR